FLLPTLTHPMSTRFPYTTLFRSAFAAELVASQEAAIAQEHDDSTCCATILALALRKLVNVPLAAENAVVGSKRKDHFLAAFTLADRKSTCLNSSHVKISYAVFCL